MNERPSFINEEAPDNGNVLQRLADLVQTQLAYEKVVADLEWQLECEKKILNNISMEQIPALLRASGLSRVKLATGETVELKEDINVTIKDKDAFFQFLKSRGDAELIKTQLAIGKVDGTKMSELYSFLMNKEYPYEADMSVHSQTTKSYFRKACGFDVKEEEREAGIRSGKYLDPAQLPEFAKVFTLTKTKITTK